MALDRVPTGISGFDQIALGGLPTGRSTLVTGTAGSGKSLFATEFLARGIEKFDEPGVFVTFEEPPDDIRINAASLGFDIAGWEGAGRWVFVDVSPGTAEDAPMVGAYDLGPLVARIEHAVRRIGARRVALDPFSSVLTRFPEQVIVRAAMRRVVLILNALGVVSVLTAEKIGDYDNLSSHGVEEFVTANVVTLRNVLELEKRRRTVEIVKFRGAPHRTGEWQFAIDQRDGIVVLPLSFVGARERASQLRISSGNDELDRMCGGGFFRDALALVTGPTGAGKTLTGLQFTRAAAAAGERCLLCTFDETRDQLGRNAGSWGMDLDAMEASGLVQVMAEYPETSSLADHLLRLRRTVERFDPTRLVIDALSALERIAGQRALLDFVTALGALLRQREITTLLTATPSSNAHPMGAPVAAIEAASLTDVTIRLHYAEQAGRNQRAISVIQTRGSAHDESIRRITIDHTGLHIVGPLPGTGSDPDDPGERVSDG